MKACFTCCAALAVFALLAPSASPAPARQPASDNSDERTCRLRHRGHDHDRVERVDRQLRADPRLHRGRRLPPGRQHHQDVHGLVPRTTRTYHVQAIDPSGNMSGLSDPITATTSPDTTAPTTPTNLKVTGTGISTVSLTWDRSSDRWSFSYEVLMDGQVLRLRGASVLGTPSTTLRKIRPGAFTFQVRARDFSGNVSGRATEPVTLTGNGDSTPPEAPTDLTRGLQRQLRQRDPQVDAVDRQRRPSSASTRSTSTAGSLFCPRRPARRGGLHAGRHEHLDRRGGRPRGQQLGAEQPATVTTFVDPDSVRGRRGSR